MAGIAAQTVGVVHVVVPAKAADDGLAELPRHAMPSVLACTAVAENIPGHLGKPEGIVEFPIGKQTGVSGTFEPWNSSFRRQSKSTRRPPCFDSPIGCAIIASLSVLQLYDSYSRIGLMPH